MSVPMYSIVVTRKKEGKMSELEVIIATELAMDSDLKGEAFWAEVSRLATFGEDWVDHI